MKGESWRDLSRDTATEAELSDGLDEIANRSYQSDPIETRSTDGVVGPLTRAALRI